MVVLHHRGGMRNRVIPTKTTNLSSALRLCPRPLPLRVCVGLQGKVLATGKVEVDHQVRRPLWAEGANDLLRQLKERTLLAIDITHHPAPNPTPGLQQVTARRWVEEAEAVEQLAERVRACTLR